MHLLRPDGEGVIDTGAETVEDHSSALLVRDFNSEPSDSANPLAMNRRLSRMIGLASHMTRRPVVRDSNSTVAVESRKPRQDSH